MDWTKKVVARTRLRRQSIREPRAPLNALEFLKARAVPDSVLTVLLAGTSALTLAPYVGGRTISFVGSSPVTVPTLSAEWFWTVVFLAPLIWALLVVRLIRASRRKQLLTVATGLGVGLLLVALHIRYPTLALNAIDANFDRAYKFHDRWQLTSQGYFRTIPRSLAKSDTGTDISGFAGCYLRVDRIEFTSGGYAYLPGGVAAFDLHVFVGNEALFEATQMQESSAGVASISSANDLQEINRMLSPVAHIKVNGHATILVAKDDLRSDAGVVYSSVFDFGHGTGSATPKLFRMNRLERNDIDSRSTDAPKIQVAAWTRWGWPEGARPPAFTFDDFFVRVIGRKHCKPW